MTDITKCNNFDCPLKQTCWRYLAPTSEYQSWSHFTYDYYKGCEYYWEKK